MFLNELSLVSLFCYHVPKAFTIPRLFLMYLPLNNVCVCVFIFVFSKVRIAVCKLVTEEELAKIIAEENEVKRQKSGRGSKMVQGAVRCGTPLVLKSNCS